MVRSGPSDRESVDEGDTALSQGVTSCPESFTPQVTAQHSLNPFALSIGAPVYWA